MYTENQELTERVRELAAQSCEELLRAYGVEVLLSASESHESEERLYCGVVGFVGRELRGTCLLLADEAPLTASRPASGSLRDWVGELANQLVGRLKSKCLARGLEIALSTPIVLSGVRVQPLPKSPLRPAVFDSASGRISVWLETESALEIVFDAVNTESTAEEGHIQLF